MSIIEDILSAAQETFDSRDLIAQARSDRRGRSLHYCEQLSNSISELAARLRLEEVPQEECRTLVTNSKS